MSFGCCHAFKECSDAGHCIMHDLIKSEGGCLYKENLDKGLNFYTEYNENNQRRANEHNQRQNTKETKEKGSQINRKYRGAYIEIPNRLFTIGKRSSYKGWTYRLDQEESEKVANVLKQYKINCSSCPNESKFHNEGGSDEDRANCRVILVINGEEFNIANYNNYA